MTVAVVVATYGPDIEHWGLLADRAMTSVEQQTVLPDRHIWVHDSTLARARNRGAQTMGCDRTIFLDADDELDARYIEMMTASTGDIVQPSTLGIVDGREDPFCVLIPEKPLIDGNYIVIGAQLNTEIFLRVGGFEEYPIYEDWDLWLRMVLAGAVVTAQAQAVYRIHVSPESRNDQDRSLQLHYYNEIRSKHMSAWSTR